MAVALIEPPYNSTTHYVTQWLRGDSDRKVPPALDKIPRTEVWKWVDEDPGKRGRYVASFAPKDFSIEHWNTTLFRELLIRFGDRRDIRDAVSANFFTGSWSGSTSGHYRRQRDELLQLQRQESNPHVLLWLRETVESLARFIEEATIEEEARGY